MATFTGTSGNDVAANPTLTGFTGGTLAELTDATGDTFNAGDGATPSRPAQVLTLSTVKAATTHCSAAAVRTQSPAGLATTSLAATAATIRSTAATALIRSRFSQIRRSAVPS